MTEATLRDTILRIGEDARASAVAVAVYDFEHHTTWSINPARWFHAASTIKVPVLLGVYDAIEQHRFDPISRVHVRNRFISVVDGRPYRVPRSSDANAEVQAAIGRMLTVHELAEHMIVTSSNLATNLLLDLVGIEAARASLARLHVSGIDLRRGVEDESAWEAGINNRVTAAGLCETLRLVEEGKAISADASKAMLDILHQQRFRSGIPAGLPEDARVAHKTGEISTVAHDAGIVYLDGRDAYVVVILTEWAPDVNARQETIARISRAVYEYMTGNRN
ncbi:MAG TPA: class A beta-lactamase-related serine hydrolase [Aquabacterium sp.]|jgi:beta-lactamase class A|uniref:serine hydrolase n=1 Tax=Comamonadaceae TaxID=80864 RepID=UPI0011D97A04|nr:MULTISPECIES: serine hydrolase [Comamonadaceae]MBK8072965.1 serine hydrolase [Ramlibacter sp.]MBP6463161.1 serine hydrolase [Rubrivivax sp.]MBP8101285.1 serine hydrolase [Burkholderiaceae bacterium]MBP9696587.1 serine hydrolase [Thermomonas sp.]MBS0596530.1 serine hydrolase [Pseudomonadota bacterium]HQC94386.1 class A beta-lactamase-related serine hydrolase [Aquabacterium sp.]